MIKTRSNNWELKRFSFQALCRLTWINKLAVSGHPFHGIVMANTFFLTMPASFMSRVMEYLEAEGLMNWNRIRTKHWLAMEAWADKRFVNFLIITFILWTITTFFLCIQSNLPQIGSLSTVNRKNCWILNIEAIWGYAVNIRFLKENTSDWFYSLFIPSNYKRRGSARNDKNHCCPLKTSVSMRAGPQNIFSLVF